LTWFADRLRSREDVRRDIPHLLGDEAQAAFADRLHDVLVSEWRQSLIGEFLAEMDAKSRPRPAFTLPWTATDSVIPPGFWRVRWNGAREVPIVSDEAKGEVAISVSGRRWIFAGESRPLLALLLTGRECDLIDLERAADGALTPDVVQTFVTELITKGLLVVV
jgi:hypothetical protein